MAIKQRIENLEGNLPQPGVLPLFEAPGGLQGQYFRTPECGGLPLTPEELRALEKQFVIILVEYREIEKPFIPLMEAPTETIELEPEPINIVEPVVFEPVTIPDDETLAGMSGDELSELLEKVKHEKSKG